MKNTKGITLVALVITIVILLILAGISISALTNQGLFGKAKEAESKSKMADARELIVLTLNEWHMDNVSNGTTIDFFLNQKVIDNEIDSFESGDDEGTYNIYKNGYVLTVDSKGNIVEDIQKAGPKPKIQNIKITTKDGVEVTDDSVKIGTPLVINFDSSIENGTIKSVTPAVPYTTNGTETEVEFVIIGTVNGTDYKKNLTVSVGKKYKQSIVNASDIANAIDKNDYYGKVVTGYTPINGATVQNWKIFYSDGNNIYLIADDYVERRYLPAGTNNKGNITVNRPTSGDYLRSAYFGNSLREDYSTGTARIIDTKIKALNNSYFEQKFTSTKNNMKSVAYMLDTNAWEGFKDSNGNADYAIGGPTVEMLINSYNQKYNTKYKAKASSAKGYQISTNNGISWKGYTDLSSEYLNLEDSLYVIKSESNALAMWLASPSEYTDDDVMALAWNGDLNYYHYDINYVAFRPLICLNANVQLLESVNGFIIK